MAIITTQIDFAQWRSLLLDVIVHMLARALYIQLAGAIPICDAELPPATWSLLLPPPQKMYGIHRDGAQRWQW
jgi:hypothetical protein